MTALHRALGHGAESFSYLLGCLVLILAATTVAFTTGIAEIGDWVFTVLGGAFAAVLTGLVLTALFSWVRMRHWAGEPDSANKQDLWFETGLQAANGVTTLALTYTLLGISLGIGGLATQELTPDSIQPIIRALTSNFSLAFMTTVIGLPVSAILRAILQITMAAQPDRHNHSHSAT